MKELCLEQVMQVNGGNSFSQVIYDAAKVGTFNALEMGAWGALGKVVISKSFEAAISTGLAYSVGAGLAIGAILGASKVLAQELFYS